MSEYNNVRMNQYRACQKQRILLLTVAASISSSGEESCRSLRSTNMGSLSAWIAPLLVSGDDALACMFEALAFGSAAMCGKSTFWYWVIAAVTFYCATWEYFFTNTLILPDINRPT
ncbi:hypothetical protein Nepgr_002336 [Nepenthes gracilis]|uniref:Uncharacterized protein n=1 Tax=Nepenthes gracilis TaxID=150966 RepID=A0AAD3RWT0_NEPGR|nr:hypothetical protein Nepgr_002336 [Nepenthes gracilis]